MTYEFLQQYWWFIISLLGGLLVFLMFVQGGNFLALIVGKDEIQRRMLMASTGRKWELTFTTLVTFGAAFFASFPLFYSTSFGGAYWVWIIILLTFVFQAVSYEFQARHGNILGSNAFRVFLAINGFFGPFLIGTAVGTFFTGSAAFTVNKAAMMPIDASQSTIISTWANGWHGLEALSDFWAVMLGFAVFFLTLTLGAMYMRNNINDETLVRRLRQYGIISSLLFLIFFLTWLIHLLLAQGFAADSNGVITMESYKYLHNFLQMPLVLVIFLLGVVLVLAGVLMNMLKGSRQSIWPMGVGTVLAVLALFLIAGYNGTAYYPSSVDLQSSLTITNSSSSWFTLRAMFYVSLAIPFVLAYIVYAWRQMDHKSITADEVNQAPVNR